MAAFRVILRLTRSQSAKPVRVLRALKTNKTPPEKKTSPTYFKISGRLIPARLPSLAKTRRVLGSKGTCILLILVVCVCASGGAQLHAFLPIPVRVYFTGVLLPMEQPSRKGLLEDFDVTIGKERRKFLLDTMKIIGAVGLNRVILQRLVPSSLHFSGADDVIDVLKSPAIVGKTFTIEGLLYTGSRMLFVLRISESAEACTAKG